MPDFLHRGGSSLSNPGPGSVPAARGSSCSHPKMPPHCTQLSRVPIVLSSLSFCQPRTGDVSPGSSPISSQCPEVCITEGRGNPGRDNAVFPRSPLPAPAHLQLGTSPELGCGSSAQEPANFCIIFADPNYSFIRTAKRPPLILFALPRRLRPRLAVCFLHNCEIMALGVSRKTAFNGFQLSPWLGRTKTK